MPFVQSFLALFYTCNSVPEELGTHEIVVLTFAGVSGTYGIVVRASDEIKHAFEGVTRAYAEVRCVYDTVLGV